jgi:hypothetical protein
MRRFLIALSTIAVLAAAIVVFASVAYAASPAQECADAGGVFVHAGPDSSCTFPSTPVGNSGNTKGGSQTTGPGKSEPNKEEEICTGVNNKPHPCP